MGRKPWFRILIAVPAVFLTAITATADTRTPTIILATNYPPFDIEEPIDSLHGFDHEVTMEVFKRQNVHAKIVYVPWSRAVHETEIGNHPGLLTCARTEDRAKHYLFSEPISREAYGIFYQNDFPVDEIRNMPDLAGYRVASVLEYAPNATLKDNGAVLVDIPSDETGFKMLELNRVDFVYTGKAAGDYILKQLGLRNKFAFKPFVIWDYHLCFSRKHPRSSELRQWFNAGLARIKADQTYTRIHEKYR